MLLWLARLMLFWLPAAIALALYAMSRSLPGFASDRLKAILSQGSASCHFERASFDILNGVRLYGFKVYRKKSLDPPLFEAGEMRLEWRAAPGRHWRDWISGIYARDVTVSPSILDGTSAARGFCIDAAFLERIGLGSESRTLVIERGDILDLKVRSLECGVTLAGDVLSFGGIRLLAESVGYREWLDGSLDCNLSSGRILASCAGEITPGTIRSLTLNLGGEGAVEYYDAISGLGAPLSVRASLDYGGRRSDYRLVLEGADFLYRGKEARRLKMALQWLGDYSDKSGPKRKLLISPLEVFFSDGTLRGSIEWNPGTRATLIEARSYLPLRTLFKVLEVNCPESVYSMEFPSPPRAELRGIVYSGAKRGESLLGGTVKSPVMAYKGMRLDNLDVDWTLGGLERLDFGRVDFGFYGGKGRGALSFGLGTNDYATMKLDLDSFSSDMVRERLLGTARPTKGRVSASFDLEGRTGGDFAKSLKGTARAKVRGGELFRIPLFAGLADFLGRNVMGLDLLLMQSDSDISLSATDGMATIEKFTVDGNMVSFVAKGKCRIDRDDYPVEGVAQLRFFHSRSLFGKLAYLATIPVSKLMEFRVFGPVSKPSWSYIGLIDRIAEATFWPREDATQGESRPMERE